MKSLSYQQIMAYGLVAAVLVAVCWILFVTPPCNGNYKFSIGGGEYIFFECVGPDLCKNLKCLNGGVCEEGVCDCPSGYSGENCEDIGDEVLALGSSRGGIKQNGRTISRSGSDWAADIVSKNYLPANKAGVIIHTVTNTTGEYALGFNRQRSSAQATDIDFGIYFAQEGPGNVKMAMHEASTLDKIGTASRGDTIRMEKQQDGTVVFMRNGSEFYRLSGANNTCLFLDLKIKNMTLQTSDFSLEGEWYKGKGDGCA